MSLRHLALYFVIAGLSIYAWKDWFKSLCGLILMGAIVEREDMPRTILHIQGFNMWNLLLLVVVLAWFVNRRREGLTWDMPRPMVVLWLIYMGVIVVGVLRALFDSGNLAGYPLKSLISEELINTVKWVLPGLLLFDGCRTRKRLTMALVCLLAVYFLIAMQVARRLPPGSVLHAGGGISDTRVACSDIGYGACDMSTLLAGASWGIVAAAGLVRQKKYRLAVFAAAAVVIYGQALTGGRAGYLAWGAIGLVVCLLKWRKCIILAPIVVILLPILLPGAAERMLAGFGQTDVAGQTVVDDNVLTSGRTEVWPLVIEKIIESPMVGHGRRAMSRLGLSQQLALEQGETYFAHPHNMYLETLLDNGIVGSLPILLFWGAMVFYSANLFRSDNRLYAAIGGAALSLMLAQLFAGVGSQHFYPEASTLGMWAALFLALRVHVEEREAQRRAVTAGGLGQDQRLPPQMALASVPSYGVVAR